MMLAAPWALLLTAPLALLVLNAWLRRQPVMVLPTLGPVAASARPTWRTRLHRLPDVLRVLALLLAILALARPREGLAVTVLPEEGIDIVAAMDVSSSMYALVGAGETRMQAARRTLVEFVDSLEGDRVGLVAFQSRALTLSPLTHDLDAIRVRARALDSGLLPDGTAIGLGVSEALALLDSSRARSRVVVLMTDGENNTGEIDPITAAQVAEALGIRVYTIGFALISGNTRGLQQIATTTGGEFFDARTADELARAYETIGNLERSRIGERKFITFREYAPALALGVVALLLFETALRSTWLRRQP
ncbi:MAG: VWA domain-containing protein [Chloroflexi bacterium]|nr:VWA domain-containing protein [Chloroflexota bacterium]MDA1239894.1 VWA domain-containing protein [Chloroflexota bacterium]MQC25376.1 VWA domain-containing protein [Chloroflexota bacterium]